MLALRGKSFFNLLSDLDITGGFCGIICYVKNEVVPIAYGVNGNKTYDWRTILNAALPPVFPSVQREKIGGEIAAYETPPAPIPTKETPLVKEAPPTPAPTPAPAPDLTIDKDYDDETVASENYYEEKEDERKLPEKTDENAHAESPTESERTQKRTDPKTNVDASRIRRAVATDPDGYYLAVKDEIDKLFQTYPRDKTLAGAFSCGEWVRVKGTAKQPEYLVGILRMDGKVRYICYALRADDKNNPPDEIKKVCTFVPCSLFQEEKGFFVLFQSTATGECIKPERA